MLIVTALRRNFTGDPTPIGTLDFVSGIYELNGATLTAADVVSHPEWITASGLPNTDFPDYIDGKTVEILGDFKSAMLGGNFSALIEYDQPDNSLDSYILTVHTTDNADILQVQRDRVSSNNYGFIYDIANDDGGTQRDIDTASTSPVISNLGTGIHKIAITRTAGKLRASINGSDALSPTNGYDGSQSGFSADRVVVGGFYDDFAFGEFYLRKLVLYSPLSDTVLPTLTV